MLYLLIGLLQRITIRVFFKHIHVANFKNIPHNKPVVIACNHPGAFMDPGFIGSIVRKPIHYITRGDVFANPITRVFLKGLNLNPIYRFDEGFGNLAKNFDTIDELAEILKKNGIILIFSEGYSALDRRLRPLRKGTARIFLQIAREHNLDIQLYASGITYTHKKNFRKSVMYSVSKPLFLKDYLTDFISHNQHAYHTFSKELARRISENFVVVSHPECDKIVDQHINYYCSNEKLPLLPVVIYNGKKLKALQELSKHINDLFVNDKQRFEQLQQDTNAYEEALHQNAITDFGLANKPLGFFAFVLMILGLPFSIPGFYFWGMPYLISKRIADKTVTRVDFYDSVNMNSLGLIYAMMNIVNNIILAFFIGWWSLFIWVIAPVLGEAAFWTYDALVQHTQATKARNCVKRGALMEMRRGVVSGQ
jgi:glycerol-3-phosphate O-acyltransferase/dihydroxyacetone phosphate acyltransferase